MTEYILPPTRNIRRHHPVPLWPQGPKTLASASFQLHQHIFAFSVCSFYKKTQKGRREKRKNKSINVGEHIIFCGNGLGYIMNLVHPAGQATRSSTCSTKTEDTLNYWQTEQQQAGTSPIQRTGSHIRNKHTIKRSCSLACCYVVFGPFVERSTFSSF